VGSPGTRTTLDVAERTRTTLDVAERDGTHFLPASTSEVSGAPLAHPQHMGCWGNLNTVVGHVFAAAADEVVGAVGLDPWIRRPLAQTGAWEAGAAGHERAPGKGCVTSHGALPSSTSSRPLGAPLPGVRRAP
jgi:hypothetical protein